MRDFDIKTLQQKELECLKEIDRLCKKHHLIYMLAWGSAIGAMRHQGFIPWDDDIDLLMPMEDYKQLKKICESELDPAFFYQDSDTDPYYYLNFAKLRMNNTTSMMKDMADYPIHSGICIDIFPMIELPSDHFNFVDRFLVKLLTFFEAKRVNDYGYGHYFYENAKLKYFPTFLCDWIRDGSRAILYRNRKQGQFYAVDGYGLFDFFLPKRLFERVVEVAFEDGMYPINSGADEFLRSYYGDYMQVPDVSQQVGHGDIIVDCENDYKLYQVKRGKK